MRQLLQSSLTSILLLTCLLFFTANNLHAQCGDPSWELSNDCGDIQASGGLAAGQPTIFCEGQTVIVENNSSPVSQITMTFIDWDDGTCQTFNGCPLSLTHAYDFPNDTCVGGSGQITFSVRLGIEKTCGNLSSFNYINFPIAVRFKPIAMLAVSDAVVCVGEEIDFSNASCENSNNPQYLWTINGETFTTENVPNYVFDNPGAYNITLAVTNSCGTDVGTVQVNSSPPATAGATASATQICAPDVVTFTNQSTSAAGQSWMIMPATGWMFTNGTNSSYAEPAIQFTTPGTYTVKLKVNGCGNPEWMTTITVLAPPAVNIAPIPDGCASGNISITPTASIGGNQPTVTWDFPGGNPGTFSGANPGSITYGAEGTYIVTATVAVNGCGTATDADTFSVAPPATAVFSLSDNDICGPDSIVSVSNSSTNANNNYLWTVMPATGFMFVNGTSATSANPQFQFTAEGIYTITLNINACGNPVATQTVNVRLKPAVSLSPTPDQCGETLTLQPASLVVFSGGASDTTTWTFLNGNPASFSGATPPAVTFNGVGNYTIRVQVQNGCGAQTIADTFLLLSPAAIVLTPVPPICQSAQPIQLQATPAGNGWSGPGVSPNGLFNPALVPDDLLGQLVPLVYQYGVATCLVRDTLEILVNGTPVDAGADKSLCNNDGAVTLTGSPAGGVWSGNGVTANGVFDPALAGGGAHALAYTFTDVATTCASNDTVVVTVLGPPTAALDSIGNVCAGAVLDLGPFAGGSGGNECHWDFGDGSTSDSCGPAHTYLTPGNYDLTLFVKNAAGCRDTAMISLQVVTAPDAKLVLDKTEGCADLSVTVDNQSTLNSFTAFIWNFGNGQIDTVQQPGTIVFGSGEHDTTYTVVLQAVNQCGSASDQQTVLVHPRPQVRFGTDVSNGCSPLEVNFNNISVGDPDFYRWYVNGVLVDTQFQLPQQVFTALLQDSTYVIALVAGNVCGIDTVLHSVLVKPNPVKAFFNTDTLVGCQPFMVRLVDYSTLGLYVSWDFGDGNVATGDTVMHTFQEAGQYFVREFVNNGCGFDTAKATITVLPAPEVSFEHAPNGCIGDTLWLENTSPNLAGSIWDFGDGTGDSTSTSPAHVYAQAGFYTITLTGLAVTTGCPATTSSTVEVKQLPTPAVVLTDSFGCQPFVFKPLNNTAGTNFYVWDFGNGATSTEVSPTYKYETAGTFTVGLRVTDLFGCKNTWSYAPLNVYPKPTAAFSYDQAALCVTPATVQFQNESLLADAYRWDFGALGASTLENPSLTVNNPTTLTVTLFVENTYTCRDTTAQEIKVYTAPNLDFAVDPGTGCAPFGVFFENFSSGVNHYAWHFGDGATSNDVAPIHVYEKAGTYSVTLYASADSICFDSLTFTNLIKVKASPTAAFTYEEVTDTTVSPNGIVRFFDASVNAIRWHWDFGDGDTSAQRNPVHRYQENGPRSVTLIVYSNNGCTDTLVVHFEPEAFGALYIPNALSPESGEPGSRVFMPVGVGLVEFEISVYASNGQRVWHSTHLDKGRPDESWDGNIKGKPAPQGLYWWKAQGMFYNGKVWNGMRYDGDGPVTEGKVLLIR